MKSQSKGIVLLLGLLVSCGGCKKQTEVEGETIPKAPACLIATQTTKELVSASQPSQLELETVTINGESFQVSTTKKSVYSYDTNGRILTEYNSYTDGRVDSVYYKYATRAVTIRTVDLLTKIDRINVIVLNSQGYAEKRLNGYQATYDRDGYLLTFKDQWGTAAKLENGNIIEELIYGQDATPSYTYKNEYDLSKTGFSLVQSFYGKASRNLLVKYTVQQNGPFRVYPNVYTVDYVYVYGDKANVKRQISKGKVGDTPYAPYMFGGSQIIINDFTYICP